jgi:hypothetical protein
MGYLHSYVCFTCLGARNDLIFYNGKINTSKAQI